MRVLLWGFLNLADDVLGYIEDAKRSTALRRFIREHPEVTVYETTWTDGTF
jgi:hypothetical protein